MVKLLIFATCSVLVDGGENGAVLLARRNQSCHLVTERTQRDSHILNFLQHKLLQQGNHVTRLRISGVFEPRLNEDSIVLLKNEVFSQVVDDDRSF